ncbi:MAG TPA: VOC family protein, partial [Myxococcota bacterium]|nr:VOC family protein [Myxococcota bacterium]
GELFGWSFDIQGPEYGNYAVAMKDGGVAAGMGQLPPDAGFPPSWTVYFAVESADAAAGAAAQQGGQVMMPPMDVGTQGRMAILVDKTGAVFGVWQPKDHTGATIVQEPGSMAWCEVNTRDAAGARAFYEGTFGLSTKPIEAGGGTEYYTMHLGELTVAGILQMTAEWGELPPHWIAYFAVEDTDASAERVKALGGKVMHGPFDTPYGRMAVVMDPQGAVFSIIKPSYL